MGDADVGWRVDDEVDPRPNDPKSFRYDPNGHYHAGFGWGSRRVVFGRDLFGGEWFVAAPYWLQSVLAAAPPAWRGGVRLPARAGADAEGFARGAGTT